MNPPRSTGLNAMGVNGAILTFDRAGDALPVHTHDEATNHITIIAKGSFRCTGNPEIEGRVITVGDILDWRAGAPHGFVALVNGARMVQITKQVEA